MNRLLTRTRAGRWLAQRTLRARLVGGLLALLAIACAIVGLMTYTQLHSVLLAQLDSELTTANLRYTVCVSPPAGQPRIGSAGQCGQQQTMAAFTAVITRPGTVTSPYLAGSDGVCRLTAAEEAKIATVPAGRVEAVDLTPYGSYEMMSRRYGDEMIVSGLPLAPVTHTLHEVAIAEIAVFLAALIVTGVIGTGWVGMSLQPLRRMAATAARVTELPLGSGEVSLPERVTDANPATEVGQVGAVLNRMLGHVESALTQREASQARLRSFAADASHELRTPLTAIRGYAELARRKAGVLPPDVAHALDRVESESARMSQLVDELLLLARLDAGRPLAADPVDLTRLIIDATADARVAAPDHHWQLELPAEPVTVRGDQQRLHQVLANLLSNACRHTPAGTSVTVGLGRGQGSAVLSVTDDGPGIPPELQREVFERFVRGGSSRSRAAGGSGLGLAIVHAVTAAHGGEATVDSRPGHTRFTITLPGAPDERGEGWDAAAS